MNEQDLNLLSDNEVNSANESLEADAACAVEEEKNKKNISKSAVSPQHASAKAPASHQKDNAAAINRKF